MRFMLDGKRSVIKAVLSVLGVFLIGDSIFAWYYVRNVNLGIVLPGLLGLLLIAVALKMTFVKGPLIQNRRLKMFLRVAIIACLAFFIAVEGLIIADPQLHRAEQAGRVDYLLVLGGGIWPDGRPTLALANRLDKAAAYYAEHPHVTIIVSGGQGSDEPTPEAEAMAKYLIDAGIPETAIIKETRSTSTMENFKFSRALIKESPEEPVRLVFITSDFHVLRARILAKRNGFEAYAIPAPTPAIIWLNSYLREFFAFIKSMLLDY